MNYPYHDLHYLSKLYREDALNDARTRQLEGRLRAERRRVDPGRSRGGLLRDALVSLLRGARLAGQSEEQR